MFGPWLRVPGVALGVLRLVPPSAIAAGLMARNDRSNHEGNAAAGDNGVSRYALAAERAFTETERDTLNTAGVNVFRELPQGVTLYGYRTLADPVADPYDVSLGVARAVMRIAADQRGIGNRHLFKTIDGEGLELNDFKGDLMGNLTDHWRRGMLYGATPQAAYRVDVGDAVNTPATIQAGELRSNTVVRVSPTAERVIETVAKRPVTEEV
jgi:phage tail sheath protein FI